MEDIRLALMTGVDIPVDGFELPLHQPSLLEISMIGEKNFFSGAQCICLDKRDYIDNFRELDETTNFQLFMTIINDKRYVDKKRDTMQVLQLLFPLAKNVVILPRSILLNYEGGNFNIDEGNFDNLQFVAREVFNIHYSDKDKFNPANEAARRIAEKIEQGRKKIAEIKSTQGSSLVLYMSILSVGLKLSLLEINKYTLFQIYDIIERYNLNEAYEIDLKVRLAGGKPEREVEQWTKNLH